MSTRKITVAIVSSYVPRQCGIATFSHDLAVNLAEHVHHRELTEDEYIRVVAMNDADRDYPYGSQVFFKIHQHQRSDYRDAADFLNTNNTQVINLQHEYGLYGGPDGNYILEFLERLKKPIVSTFHTVLTEPSPGQRETLSQIGRLSNGVIILAERAQKLCNEVYDIPRDKLHLIHHGTPDVEFHHPNDFKAKLMLKDRPVILTFGLLGPGKGIENMLDALAIVARKHPNVAYLVVGATHPGVKRELGESYRLALETRAVDLGITQNVFFHNHYVSLPTLVEFLKASDVYVTPYRNKEQIVSGTLAFALACGKAIVSTPYWYAQEILADGRGRLAEFNDPHSLAHHITELLDQPNLRLSIQKKAYAFGRQMIWSSVAKEYDKLYARSIKKFSSRKATIIVAAKPGLKLSLPELRLDHLYRMTDDTGILQHATYSTPNRQHGYCTDDNARALQVAVMNYRLQKDVAILPYLERYFSFIQHAWNPDRSRFRNFMSYDRHWLDEDGTEDCLGRVLLALSYLVSHPPRQDHRELAYQLLDQVLGGISGIDHPRAMSLCIIAFHYYLRSRSHEQIQAMLTHLSRQLVEKFERHQGPDWCWLEDHLTYGNARIPQALILAGKTLRDDKIVMLGLNSLRWLLQVQTAPDGHLSLVGNEGWWQRRGVKPQFAQQPIEARALAEACKSAYQASNQQEWFTHMWRCFEWFLGKNDVALSLVDFTTHGCCDGLHAHGVNRNQGAESTLSWLVALHTMYEMHPGQPPDQ